MHSLAGDDSNAWAPGQSQGAGRRTGAVPRATSHGRALPCLVSSHCAAHGPLGHPRAVRLTPRCLTLVPPRAPTGKTCRYGKTDLCEGMSVLHEGQWEIRLTGLSSIHSRRISYRLLLFRIYFAISNTCPNQELPHWPKVFGVFPFLDSLVGPLFLKENNLFAQKKWNNTHNLSVLWWWQKLHSPLSLTDNLRGFG